MPATPRIYTTCQPLTRHHSLPISDRDNGVWGGSARNKRKITNVAAGTEDTDAVNKSQLDEVAGSVGELTDTVVQYDDEDKDTVTLAGEEGTAIGNVAAGSVRATSMDAINGGPLYGALDSTAQMLGGGAAVTAFGTISAPTYMVQGGNYLNRKSTRLNSRP